MVEGRTTWELGVDVAEVELLVEGQEDYVLANDVLNLALVGPGRLFVVGVRDFWVRILVQALDLVDQAFVDGCTEVLEEGLHLVRDVSVGLRVGVVLFLKVIVTVVL